MLLANCASPSAPILSLPPNDLLFPFSPPHSPGFFSWCLCDTRSRWPCVRRSTRGWTRRWDGTSESSSWERKSHSTRGRTRCLRCRTLDGNLAVGLLLGLLQHALPLSRNLIKRSLISPGLRTKLTSIAERLQITSISRTTTDWCRVLLPKLRVI